MSGDISSKNAISGTESELRVDVFVDTITRIAIRTTSLELLLEETPSTFGIVAYDDDGKFSTNYLIG